MNDFSITINIVEFRYFLAKRNEFLLTYKTTEQSILKRKVEFFVYIVKIRLFIRLHCNIYDIMTILCLFIFVISLSKIQFYYTYLGRKEKQLCKK